MVGTRSAAPRRLSGRERRWSGERGGWRGRNGIDDTKETDCDSASLAHPTRKKPLPFCLYVQPCCLKMDSWHSLERYFYADMPLHASCVLLYLMMSAQGEVNLRQQALSFRHPIKVIASDGHANCSARYSLRTVVLNSCNTKRERKTSLFNRVSGSVTSVHCEPRCDTEQQILST